MATQFIKNNVNFSDLEHWQGFSSVVEKDGFKSLNLKQISANYDEYIELKEESTYTLWCEINSTYLQQISTIKGLLFDCFFVKDDGSYDSKNIYDAYSSFEIKSQERSLQPNKWQVIELRIYTKSLDDAKEDYTRIMFRPKFLFNNDEENGIDIYIKNVSFEDSDRRYYGNNLIVDSSKCENEIYKLNDVNRIPYRYYGGYIFEAKDNLKGSVSFNVAKDLFKHRILRSGDKVKYSIFARTTSENIKYSNMAFYMKRYNINTQEDVESYFYKSEYVGDIDDIWRRFEFVFTVTSQMIDDSGNNLLWGDSGIFFNGTIEDESSIYYACPMLEIVGDDSSFSEEWIPNKKDDIYKDYMENLIMSYGNYEKDVKLYIRKNGSNEEKEISEYSTSYEEEDSSSSTDTFKLGNVGSKSVKIAIRNYDDEGNEILPRDLTNYILYVEKYYQNGYDDSGDIVVTEGKYKIYENPEDFSSNMNIEFQDRMVELDIEYDSKLDYPTNVKQQLIEIATTTNMTIDYSQVDEEILNEEINFYDNTYTKREYLSWIAEKSSCNVFIDDDKIILKKINKDNIKEQYIDYASQSLTIGDKFLLRTVTFDNGVQYYSKSNDLFMNDDSTFSLEKTSDNSELSLNTEMKINLEKGKIYTFDFKSNISIFGNEKNQIKAKLVNSNDEYSIEIESFQKTFECLNSSEYTLYFYFNAENIGDIATFSNIHIVEGETPYGITNTFYISNENMYINSQKDIDRIYSSLFGIDIFGCKNLSLMIGNPKIQSTDLLKLRFIDELESLEYKNVPMIVYIANHKLVFNSSYKSSFECPIQSTNEENTTVRTNVDTRIKKISVNVNQNEQKLQILAEQQDEFEQKQSEFSLSLDEIKLSITNVTDRLESAEIKLEPTNILLAVNTSIDNGESIQSTKFQIDKDGVHISGGGLDIKNNSGEKVFYANTSGNLTLTGTITGSNIVGSYVNGTQINGGSINGSTIYTEEALYVGNEVHLNMNNNEIMGIYYNYNDNIVARIYLNQGQSTTIFSTTNQLLIDSDISIALSSSSISFAVDGYGIELTSSFDSSYDAFFKPYTDGITLGTTSNRFYRLYCKLSPDVSSDKRLKEDFTNFDERYIKFFEMLNPTLYKLKSLSKDKSKLAGFIAQDVEKAMNTCGIDKKEFGIYKYDDENDSYSLVYEMFIPLIVYYILNKK